MSESEAKGTKEDARRKIQELIKNIQPQISLLSKQKKHLSEFAAWFFRYQPDVSERDIMYLYVGSDDKRGLLDCCGNTSIKSMLDIKASSVYALELLYMLLEPAHNKNNSDKFRETLGKVDLDQLKAIRLDRHISSDRGNRELAFQVVSIILAKAPYQVNEFVDSAEAIRLFQRWQESKEEQEEKDDNVEQSDDDDDEPEPEFWKDVTIDPNFEKEEERQAQASTQVIEGDQHKKHESDSEDEQDPLGLDGTIREDSAGDEREGGRWAVIGGKKKKRKSRRDVVLPLHILGDPSLQQGSISTSQEDFNPRLYLTKVHAETSYNKLKRGLDTLEAAVRNRADQMRKLVKEHFDQFVYCKDTIDTIHILLQQELSTETKGRSQRLLSAVESIQDYAQSLYAPLLDKKKQSERMRGVMNLLTKFRYVFSLPGNIQRNIANEQYDKVVRDYKKIKPFAVGGQGGDANSAVLRQVLDQVNQIIGNFRHDLMTKLKDPKAVIEDQHRLIGYLSELDCEEDPVWFYLTQQHQNIHSLMDDAFRVFSARAGTELPSELVPKEQTAAAKLKHKLTVSITPAPDGTAVPIAPSSSPPPSNRQASALSALAPQEEPAPRGLERSALLSPLPGPPGTTQGGLSRSNSDNALTNSNGGAGAGGGTGDEEVKRSHRRGGHAAMGSALDDELLERLARNSSSGGDETTVIPNGVEIKIAPAVSVSVPAPSAPHIGSDSMRASRKSPMSKDTSAFELASDDKLEAVRRRLVLQLSEILVRHVPDFFRLAKEIDQGHFARKSPAPARPGAQGQGQQAGGKKAGPSLSVADRLEGSERLSKRSASAGGGSGREGGSSTPRSALMAELSDTLQRRGGGGAATASAKQSARSVSSAQTAEDERKRKRAADDSEDDMSGSEKKSVSSSQLGAAGGGGGGGEKKEGGEGKDAGAPPAEQSHMEFRDMISAVMRKYAAFVRTCVFPPHLKEYHMPSSSSSDQYTSMTDPGPCYLTASTNDAVVRVLGCFRALSQLNMPAEYTQDLRDLVHDLVVFCVTHTFRRAMVIASRMHRQEDWNVKPEGGMTTLPDKFSTLMTDTLNSFKPVFTATPAPLTLSDGSVRTSSSMPNMAGLTASPSLRAISGTSMGGGGGGLFGNAQAWLSLFPPSWLLQLVVPPFVESLRIFADQLHRLAFKKSASEEDVEPRVRDHTEDRRLLAVFSNVLHCSDTVFPTLWQQLQEVLPFSAEAVLDDVENSLDNQLLTLEELLFDHYISRKALAANRFIKKGLVTSGMDWKNAPEPTEVRHWVLELLLELVYVHDEVYTSSKKQLATTMEHILQCVVISFQEYLREVDQLSRNGALQLLSELDFIQHILAKYSNKTSDEVVLQIEEQIAGIAGFDPQGDKVFQKKRAFLVSSIERSTHVMFECFLDKEPESSSSGGGGGSGGASSSSSSSSVSSSGTKSNLLTVSGLGKPPKVPSASPTASAATKVPKAAGKASGATAAAPVKPKLLDRASRT